MDKLFVFPGATKETPVAYHRGRMISYAELLSDVAALTKALPKQHYQINLCEDRYYFLVGYLAALCLGQTVLLPPTRAVREIDNIAKEYCSTYRLIDQDADRGKGEYHFLGGVFAKQKLEVANIGFPAEQPAIKLYTSGSTGKPVAHTKTWGMLHAGALLLGNRLQLKELQQFSLLATVPQQHMYGLETSIMLPLVWNGIVTAERPLMPGDIRAYATELPSPLLLATTPLHISSCVDVKLLLPDMQQILSATAPLMQSLACAARDLFSTEVIEIYGSTEIGAIATRFSDREDYWTLLPGIKLQNEQDVFSARLAHYADVIPLHDHIKPIDDNRFELLGRNSDLIKIAGKRASLADLNRKLLEIDAVKDGVFYLPEETKPATLRTSVFVVAAEADRQCILNGLRERIDPAFVPRELFFVEQLPRNATGKISKHSLDKLYQQQ